MAEPMGFRVCVDGRDMRKDIKSRFFIYVDLLRDRCIRDIEKRITDFLCVDNPISLMIGSVYLPSSENVRLLCVGDVLKVVEQNKECYNNKEDANCRHEDEDIDRQIYMKGHKAKKKKRKRISGDVNDINCSTVKGKVQKSETLPVNLEECAEYSEQKGKKRRKETHSNKRCMSDEQCVTEELKCEELSDGFQRSVEERRERKPDKREGNNVYVKSDDIPSSVASVTRASEQVTAGPKTPETGSQENGSIEIGVCADAIPDNENSPTKDGGTKRRRKRTRRHKKDREPEQNETKGKLPVSVEDHRRGTFIQSVTAARTHIRFADFDEGNDKVEFQMESEPTSVRLGGTHPVVTLSDVCAVSSEINGQGPGEMKVLVSQEGSSTKWNMQAVDNLESDDVVCNNDTFAKLLAYENFSAPRVYKRKKSSVTANGDTSETLSNTDVENRQQIKTDDRITNFSQFPILKDTPKEGDIIAFKMLKLGEDYTPKISDYITAKVLSYCKETYQLMVKVLGGHEECQKPKGKFDLEDDNAPETCVVDDLEVNWNEILETRLVYP